MQPRPTYIREHLTFCQTHRNTASHTDSKYTHHLYKQICKHTSMNRRGTSRATKQQSDLLYLTSLRMGESRDAGQDKRKEKVWKLGISQMIQQDHIVRARWENNKTRVVEEWKKLNRAVMWGRPGMAGWTLIIRLLLKHGKEYVTPHGYRELQ